MLEEMAMYQITHNNTDIAAIIKNIHHREEIKTFFRFMKPIAKGFKPVHKDIYNDDEVVSKLIHHNKLHLNQTWETPCAKGLLWDYIGEHGLGIGSQDILS
eukprot:15367193-Ditylum_brightwellii.AAC.6